MAEGNDDQNDGGQGSDEQPLTIEQVQAENKRLADSVKKLEDASRKQSAENKRLREAEEARQNAARKRELEGKPEAEQWEHKYRELETEKQRLERERDEEKQGRVRDKQDVQILNAIGSLGKDQAINPRFNKYVCLEIDRSMFEVDDSGRIVAGLKEGIAKVLRENPDFLLAKPTDRGTGHQRQGQQRQATATKEEDRNPFQERTSFGT